MCSVRTGHCCAKCVEMQLRFPDIDMSDFLNAMLRIYEEIPIDALQTMHISRKAPILQATKFKCHVVECQCDERKPCGEKSYTYA